jgi:ribonuclease HII
MTPRKKFDRSLIPERPNLAYESELWHAGVGYIAGVDEAGRGALAGPVAVGAVVLPSQDLELYDRLHGVRDSKQMSPSARDIWGVIIKEIALSWGVGFATAKEIDNLGIAPAIHLAAARAISQLTTPVEHLLVDYMTLPNLNIPQTPLVKGDGRSLSIAAASILAKITRDAALVKLDQKIPGYGFAQNKGYGTLEHRKAIKGIGPCEEHRYSFSPIKEYHSLFPDQV